MCISRPFDCFQWLRNPINGGSYVISAGDVLGCGDYLNVEKDCPRVYYMVSFFDTHGMKIIMKSNTVLSLISTPALFSAIDAAEWKRTE